MRERTFALLRSRPDERFRAREIAEWIHKSYPAETAEKLAKSSFLKSEGALLGQIVGEIGANRPAWQKRYNNLRTTEGRPRRFYWTEKTEADEVEQAERVAPVDQVANYEGLISPNPVLERDLYPLLVEFVASEFGASAFRINEATASNKKGRARTSGYTPMWLHLRR